MTMPRIPAHTTHHITGMRHLGHIPHTQHDTTHTTSHDTRNDPACHDYTARRMHILNQGIQNGPGSANAPAWWLATRKSHHPGSLGPLYIPWAAGPRPTCPPAHPLPDTWQSHASHNGHECGETQVVPPHSMCYYCTVVLLHGPLLYMLVM